MEEKDKITETTTFDERRKLLVHKSKEEKTNDFGKLVIETEAEIHEAGIRQTVKDLTKRKNDLKESIQSFREVLEPAPKMTAELEELKKNLKTLQLIQHGKKSTPESIKKEKDNLKASEEMLKNVEKDIKDIEDAIRGRLNLK